MEDLKDRYYAIARKLLSSREGGEAAVANHTLIRYPYNKEHEVQRKRAVEMMLARTTEQADEENAVRGESVITGVGVPPSDNGGRSSSQ